VAVASGRKPLNFHTYFKLLHAAEAARQDMRSRAVRLLCGVTRSEMAVSCSVNAQAARGMACEHGWKRASGNVCSRVRLRVQIAAHPCHLHSS
jgi:hypothetical protein